MAAAKSQEMKLKWEAENFIEGQKYKEQTPEERQTDQNQTCHAILLLFCL